jgi:hypothetical protein
MPLDQNPHINGLNYPSNGTNVSFDQKVRSKNLLSTETYLKTKDTHKVKVEYWKKTYTSRWKYIHM